MACCLSLLLFLAAVWAGKSYAATPPAGTLLQTRAWAQYRMPDEIAAHTLYSNSLQAEVAAVEGVALLGPLTFKVQPGSTVVIPYNLVNTGNTASHIQLSASNGGPGCGPDSFDLSNLHWVVDSNDNGVPDSNEPIATAKDLQAGASEALLLVGQAPQVAGGTACLSLTATTAAQAVSARSNTTALIDNGAALRVTEPSSSSGYIAPGSTIGFSVRATNNGLQNASPATTNGAAVPAQILVNGVAQRALLLRNPIPAGTTYMAGTLVSGNPNVLKLYRLPGDAPFSYRTVEDASAIEVAVAELLPWYVAPGGALGMGFSVRVAVPTDIIITSQAEANYFDGNVDTLAPSNPVTLDVAGQSVGVALSAAPALSQSPTTGKVHFTAVVKNYGDANLYNLQVHHPVESSTGLGSYTAGAPGVGQYSVVPGSLRITGLGNALNPPQVNSHFDGRASSSDGLFNAPITLETGTSVTVEYDLLVNFTGWTAARSTQASAAAARTDGGALDITDLSQNGLDPDPNTNGPTHSNQPTPIQPMQMLALEKSVDSLVNLGNGQYAIGYRITARNAGLTPATGVRISDNLGCALASAGIHSWRITVPPAATQGVLRVASAFTGNAPCNTAVDPTTGVPLATTLSLTDGSRDLGVGQSETLLFTVQVQTSSAQTVLTNAASVASIDGSSGTIMAATSGSATSLLVDPQGIVYDSSTRQPIAGALVTIARQSCSIGTAGPISPSEVYNGALSVYRFNPDGSLSMRTDASGQYQFFWKSPPLDSLCTYAVQVTPPDGYVASRQFAAQGASFSNCGNVVPNVAAPQAADPTTWYSHFVSGINTAAGTVCEVFHNHIPLDPKSATGLLLDKQGSKTLAEFGDFLDYRLTLSNHTGGPLAGVSLQDTLPPGLAYVPNSTRLNGVAGADPAGGRGPTLDFAYPATTLATADKLVLQYRVRVGVGAPSEGDVVNRATGHAGGLVSNAASFKTHISGGAFSDDAYVEGKVFLDCNRNGVQDGPDEPGVPGVLLFLEDGSRVLTDAQGRWSLFGLKPITHVVRLDTSTLPAQATLQAIDNRNAGAADSRFIDPKKGELVKANFAVVGCSEAVRAEVQARGKALAGKGELEDSNLALPSTQAAASQRASDVRGLGAAGSLATGSAQAFAGALATTAGGSTAGALIALPKDMAPDAEGPAAASTDAQVPAPAPASAGAATAPMRLVTPGTAELESLIQDTPAQPGFMELQDQDTVSSSVLNIRLKGPLDTTLLLTVNGSEVPTTRVGKKVSLESRALQAWEYIGVELHSGLNTLQADVVDAFGVHRASALLHLHAPGALARLHLEVPQEPRADPLQPLKVVLQLRDAHGVPIVARTQVTLDAEQGAWLEPDLNPLEPGIQINVTGGEAVLSLRPPADPGLVRLRASANPVVEEVAVRFLPQDRPMRGIGLVEGVIDLSQRGTLALGQIPAGAAFEQELQALGDSADSSRAAARAAFYFKGTILGQYLLTTAYDSNKQLGDRLFRDIKPDQYYPVYGDSSARGYDAQSSGRLYVRIDSTHSYVLLGDFTTASSEEVRKISQISRNLNGVKSQYETANVRVTAYATRNGLSGTVFNDGGAPSAGSNTGTPNDGLQNGNEAGLGGIALTLSNCAGTSYASTTTDGAGAYSLSIPPAQAGQTVCLDAAVSGAYLATGMNVAGTAVPSGVATTVGGTSYSFTRSSDRVAFTAPASGAVTLNFGQVPVSTFATSSNKQGAPGSSVAHTANTFTAGSGGSLQISLGAATATPSSLSWSEVVYLDPSCTGTLQAGLTKLTAPTVSVPVTQGQVLCLIVQDFVPTSATAGATNAVPVVATLSLGNANPALTASYTVTDTTTVGSGQLAVQKEVRNVTQSGSFGASNQAKPGDTLEYRITYTNLGASTISGLEVADYVPQYGTFVSATADALPASLTACSKNTPANVLPAAAVPCSTAQGSGGTGSVNWKFSGTLAPGATGTVRFSMQVN